MMITCHEVVDIAGLAAAMITFTISCVERNEWARCNGGFLHESTACVRVLGSPTTVRSHNYLNYCYILLMTK